MNNVSPVSPAGQRMVLISGAFAALTVAMAAVQLIKNFQSMAQDGVGGVGTVSIVLWETGRTAVVGLALTTLIALATLAVCAARRNSFQLPPAWICLLSGFLTLLPAALLYAAAAKVFEITVPPAAGAAAAAGGAASIGATATMLARLLVSASGLGVVVPVILLLLAFLLKPRPGTKASWLAWGTVCAVYVLLLVHLFLRLAWLQDVAMRGSL